MSNRDKLLEELYTHILKIVRDKSNLQPLEVFKARNVNKSDKELEQEILLMRKIMKEVENEKL